MIVFDVMSFDKRTSIILTGSAGTERHVCAGKHFGGEHLSAGRCASGLIPPLPLYRTKCQTADNVALRQDGHDDGHGQGDEQSSGACWSR